MVTTSILQGACLPDLDPGRGERIRRLAEILPAHQDIEKSLHTCAHPWMPIEKCHMQCSAVHGCLWPWLWLWLQGMSEQEANHPFKLFGCTASTMCCYY